MNQDVENLIYGTRTRRLYDRFTEDLKKKYSLTKIDMDVIYYLYTNGEQYNTPKDLLELQVYTKGHISQSVHRMVDRGLVHLEKDEYDRRFAHILLNEGAVEIAKEVELVHQDIQDIVMQNLEDEELKIAMDVIRKMTLNIESALGEK